MIYSNPHLLAYARLISSLYKWRIEIFDLCKHYLYILYI